LRSRDPEAVEAEPTGCLYLKGADRLRCPTCGKSSPDPSNFCTHCGARLPDALGHAGSPVFTRGRIVVFGVLGIGFLGLLLWWGMGLLDVDRPTVVGNTDVQGDAAGGGRDSVSNGKSAHRNSDGPEAPGGSLKAVVGRVTIEHRLGMQLAEIPAAVIAERWIALPVRACYGGDIWGFRPQEGDPVRMVAGLWRDGDPLALWELEEGTGFKGPNLGSWEPHAHLTWKSLFSDRTRSVLRVTVKERSDRFAVIVSDDFPKESGLFFQEDEMVGWTFGSPQEEGILWVGPPGEDLVSTIRVDHFYNLTFANGREEHFLRALATGRDLPVLERLELLAEGFRRRPELLPEETPALLAPGRAALRMQEIASDLAEKGFAHEVADLLDVEVLKEAKSVELMKQALQATRSYYGSASTVDLAERLLEETENMPDFDAVAFRSYAKTVFLDWMGERIDQADTLGAWRAYRRADALFPDAMDVRLTGVEIALKDGDWKRAKDLLPSRSVPAPWSELAARLAAEISRLEAEEGKLVIRFRPGSRYIPVEALLNHQVEQDFAIDTGASLVTIPSSTAEALGLKMNHRTPQRIVSTAGGPVRAWEVTLDSVTVKGLSVNEVKAWVLDIPGQSSLGLLGLNYLNRFHMEIDNDRGVLMLKPR